VYHVSLPVAQISEVLQQGQNQCVLECTRPDWYETRMETCIVSVVVTVADVVSYFFVE